MFTRSASPTLSAVAVLAALSLVSCTGHVTAPQVAATSTGTTALPDAYRQYASNLHVYVDGSYVVVESNGVPDHKSPYFATSDPRYEAYDGDNAAFMLAPGRIQAQSY